MKPQPKIFLSYARPDRDQVEQVYQKLVGQGYKPWMDSQDILPGEKWEISIDRALRQADFVIVFISPNSTDRRGVLQKEIKKALDYAQEKLDGDIYLIPARLEDCPAPDNLQDRQWVDMFKPDGWNRLIKAIEAGIAQRK